MESFSAFRIHEDDGAIRAQFEQINIDDLTEVMSSLRQRIPALITKTR